MPPPPLSDHPRLGCASSVRTAIAAEPTPLFFLPSPKPSRVDGEAQAPHKAHSKIHRPLSPPHPCTPAPLDNHGPTNRPIHHASRPHGHDKTPSRFPHTPGSAPPGCSRIHTAALPLSATPTRRRNRQALPPRYSHKPPKDEHRQTTLPATRNAHSPPYPHERPHRRDDESPTPSRRHPQTTADTHRRLVHIGWFRNDPPRRQAQTYPSRPTESDTRPPPIPEPQQPGANNTILRISSSPLIQPFLTTLKKHSKDDVPLPCKYRHNAECQTLCIDRHLRFPFHLRD